MSVSDIPYPGNEGARPRLIGTVAADTQLYWCVLDADDDAIERLRAWLAPQEHARAARYAHAPLARRYVAGRAALRWILARRLGTMPPAVPIERGHRGRPQLAHDAGIDFNVSNTRNVAVIAVCGSRGMRVGIDVEHGDRTLNHRSLARKFLTPREHRAIDGLADDEHRRAFLRAWTCKEAMSKATGEALSAPLRRLDVRLSPALTLIDGPGPYVPEDWSLLAVDVPQPYLATLALWRARPVNGDFPVPDVLDRGGGNR